MVVLSADSEAQKLLSFVTHLLSITRLQAVDENSPLGSRQAAEGLGDRGASRAGVLNCRDVPCSARSVPSGRHQDSSATRRGNHKATSVR